MSAFECCTTYMHGQVQESDRSLNRGDKAFHWQNVRFDSMKTLGDFSPRKWTLVQLLDELHITFCSPVCSISTSFSCVLHFWFSLLLWSWEGHSSFPRHLSLCKRVLGASKKILAWIMENYVVTSSLSQHLHLVPSSYMSNRIRHLLTQSGKDIGTYQACRLTFCFHFP